MVSDNIERAKQFLAFDALKGLNEALREKEKLFFDKDQFFKDDENNLLYKLSQLKIGMVIEVTFYDNNDYLYLVGAITNIDRTYKTITIADKKIHFTKIVNLQGKNINDLYGC